MTNVIIVHGTEGNPEGNWFPWLKQELEKLGCQVFVPRFPTPVGQNLTNWLKELDAHKEYIGKDTILVGHSLGPAFILNVLERLDHPVKAAFLVAGFTGRLGFQHFDDLNSTFADKEFDWDRIRKNCKQFYILNSDNDPYVPLEKGKELVKRLKTKLTIVKGAGHMNQEFGYTKFDLLLEMMKKEL